MLGAISTDYNRLLFGAIVSLFNWVLYGSVAAFVGYKVLQNFVWPTLVDSAESMHASLWRVLFHPETKQEPVGFTPKQLLLHMSLYIAAGSLIQVCSISLYLDAFMLTITMVYVDGKMMAIFAFALFLLMLCFQVLEPANIYNELRTGVSESSNTKETDMQAIMLGMGEPFERDSAMMRSMASNTEETHMQAIMLYAMLRTIVVYHFMDKLNLKKYCKNKELVKLSKLVMMLWLVGNAIVIPMQFAPTIEDDFADNKRCVNIYTVVNTDGDTVHVCMPGSQKYTLEYYCPPIAGMESVTRKEEVDVVVIEEAVVEEAVVEDTPDGWFEWAYKSIYGNTHNQSTGIDTNQTKTETKIKTNYKGEKQFWDPYAFPKMENDTIESVEPRCAVKMEQWRWTMWRSAVVGVITGTFLYSACIAKYDPEHVKYQDFMYAFAIFTLLRVLLHLYDYGVAVSYPDYFHWFQGIAIVYGAGVRVWCCIEKMGADEDGDAIAQAQPGGDGAIAQAQRKQAQLLSPSHRRVHFEDAQRKKM